MIKKLFKLTLQLFIIITLSVLVSSVVHAVPANPYPVMVEQADAPPIEIYGRGDEFFNWTEDENGNVIAYDDESGNWCYAYISDGQIVPGEEVAGSTNMNMGRRLTSSTSRISEEDLSSLIENADRSIYSQEIQSVNIQPFSMEQSGVQYGENNAPPDITITKLEQDMLVILIEYNNVALVRSMEYWKNHHFSTTGNTVNSYYAEVSNNKFQFRSIAFNISNQTIKTGLPAGVSEVTLDNGVAKVKLNKNHPGYTPNNNTAIDNDVKLAFSAVAKYITLSSYDQYNKYIRREDLHVSTVVAGFERSNDENASNASKAVWAHASYMYFSEPYTVVGVDMNDPNNPKLTAFTTQGEIYSGSAPMGIGVTVHELGHSLGLPDLYDTTYASQGVGAYSLMASGSWGKASDSEQPGSTPTHLDAWSKMRLGFVEPIEIQGDKAFREIDVKSITGSVPDNNYNVLKITSDADPDQYFLVENRQLAGYDEGLHCYIGDSAGGIIIYHIDDSVIEKGGRINDNWQRKGVDVEEANGCTLLDGKTTLSADNYKGHFFSTDAEFKYEFNNKTTPNSKFYESSGTAQNVQSSIQIEIKSSRGESMTVAVGDSANANVPYFTEHPQSKTVEMGASVTLEVQASVSATGGYLSYQWYSNTSNSTTGGTAINNETNNSYSPTTSAYGTTYYYVVVTNTFTKDGEEATETATSKIAKVTVQPKSPTFTTDLSSGTIRYALDATASSLTVSATIEGGAAGSLSYQWYANGTRLTGVTGSTYTPSTSKLGTTSYYVEAVNTHDNHTAVTRSKVVTVVVYDPNASSTGIDYSAIVSIIISGSEAGHFINLTEETIIVAPGYSVAAYSIDGGQKWKAAKSDMFSESKFPKMLNKDMTLCLSDKSINKKTKKPESGAIIVRFAKINKRPKAPSLTVNYEVGDDETGATAGTWILTKKKSSAAVKDGIEIGKAAENKKSVDERGYGLFLDGDGNGVQVIEMSGEKAEKLIYFIRYAPKQSGSSYTAASKPKKISVSSQIKAPKYKVNEKKSIIKLKANTSVVMGGTVKFYKEKAELDLKDFSGTIEIWTNATAKKPASKKQVLTIQASQTDQE